MKKDILSEIIANKRFEVDLQKSAISTRQMAEKAERMLEEEGNHPRRRSMKEALTLSPTGIIAEFKRRSPSKGWIRQEATPQTVTTAYERAGATALSILTDEKFFGGTLRDLRTARNEVQIPILQKEFIIDEYQLYQARVVGADAVLLIAAALEREQCRILESKAHVLGLEVLLEIHNAGELDYIGPETDMIGINNRHLGSFHTDVETSFQMAERLPKGRVWVSESGISNPETVRRLREAGFRGFLIGETFMKTANPGETLNEFIKQL